MLAALLLTLALEVAAVRFANPPRTMPMLLEQGGELFSIGPNTTLRYRWIDLEQRPEVFLKHLWISEDERFFQHDGCDWKQMDLAMKKAERTGKPVRGASASMTRPTKSIRRFWLLSMRPIRRSIPDVA